MYYATKFAIIFVELHNNILPYTFQKHFLRITLVFLSLRLSTFAHLRILLSLDKRKQNIGHPQKKHGITHFLDTPEVE
jgi:hypothetical protein